MWLPLSLPNRKISDTLRKSHVATVKADVSVWVLVKSVVAGSNRNKYHKYFLEGVKAASA